MNRNLNQQQFADTLPPDPGTSEIPEGHIRLWHYTSNVNVPSIQESGLQRKYARGDAGNHDLTDPSAGVWASTKRPDELLNSHDSGKSVVEFHADPKNLSPNAETPWHSDPKEWATGYHHVIMQGDVPKENISAIHEPWHSSARYMRDDPKGPESYNWVKEDYAKDPVANAHLEPYIRGLKALEGQKK